MWLLKSISNVSPTNFIKFRIKKVFFLLDMIITTIIFKEKFLYIKRQLVNKVNIGHF